MTARSRTAGEHSLAWVATVLAVFVLCHVAPRTSYGQDDPFAALSDAEALELIEVLDEADRARDEARWEDALTGYLAFVEVVPDEHVWFEAARVMLELGRVPESARVLETLSHSTDAEVAAAAGRSLGGLVDSYPARLVVIGTPEGAWSTFTDAAGTLYTFPSEQPINLRAGVYVVSVQAAGFHAATWRLDLMPGEERSIHPRMTRADAPLPANAPGAPAYLSLSVRPRAATVRVDGPSGALEGVSARETLVLSPGQYRLRVEHPGFETHETWLSLTGNQTEELTVELAAVYAPHVSARESDLQKVATYGLAAGSGALLVTSIGLFVRASRLDSEASLIIALDLAGGSLSDDSYDAVDRFERSRRAARATLGVGLTLGVAAVVAALVPREPARRSSHSSRAPTSAARTVYVGPDGVGMSFRW